MSKPLESELFPHHPRCRRADACAFGGRVPQPEQRGTKDVGVAGRDEKGGFAVADVVADAERVGHDDGFAARHRAEQDGLPRAEVRGVKRDAVKGRAGDQVDRAVVSRVEVDVDIGGNGSIPQRGRVSGDKGDRQVGSRYCAQQRGIVTVRLSQRENIALVLIARCFVGEPGCGKELEAVARKAEQAGVVVALGAGEANDAVGIAQKVADEGKDAPDAAFQDRTDRDPSRPFGAGNKPQEQGGSESSAQFPGKDDIVVTPARTPPCEPEQFAHIRRQAATWSLRWGVCRWFRRGESQVAREARRQMLPEPAFPVTPRYDEKQARGGCGRLGNAAAVRLQSASDLWKRTFAGRAKRPLCR